MKYFPLLLLLTVAVAGCMDVDSAAKARETVIVPLDRPETTIQESPSEAPIANPWMVLDHDFVPEIYEETLELGEMEMVVEDSEKERLAKLILPQFPIQDFPIDTEELLPYLTFTNLNGDGQMDVIYNGNIGMEAMAMIGYVAEGEGLREWFRTYQRPVETEINDSGLISFKVIDDGCCAAYMTKWLAYEMNPDTAELVGKVKMIHGTDLEGKTLRPVRFEVTRPEYHLRTHPVIDDTTYNERDDWYGNSVGKMVAGQRGTAYKSQIDETGRVWWLVQTDPLDTIVKPFFYGDFDYPTRYIGWVSSRFVKELP